MTASVVDRLRELRLDAVPAMGAPAVEPARPRARRGRMSLAAGIGLVAAAAALGVATRKKAVAPPSVAPAAQAAPVAAPAAALVAAGFVVPQRSGTIGSQVTGQIREILVREGDRVRAGQVIAHVDDADARAALGRARAAQAEAQQQLAGIHFQRTQAAATLARQQALSARGFTTRASLDASAAESGMLGARVAAAEAALAGASASVRAAEVTLGRFAIRAPFSGVVIDKNAEVGELVSPISAGGGFTRTGIVTIVDMASLHVEADVNEAYIGKVRAGQPVTLSFDALPGETFDARVSAIVPSADRNRATVRVNIALVRRDPRILPQMAAKAAFLPSASNTGSRQ
ncbi:efflux RND transporter periplasmic adaptor subunit [Sphingomonas trueperi]|uniref:efflux RND transporter periplasmic adaptor subunit n=1 Tax=Sphingomonas trueperi TaxID=53317 RepID=UPI0031DC7CE8